MREKCWFLHGCFLSTIDVVRGLHEYFSRLYKQKTVYKCAVAIFLQHLLHTPLIMPSCCALIWLQYWLESNNRAEENKKSGKLLVMPQTPFNADKSAKSFSIFDYALGKPGSSKTNNEILYYFGGPYLGNIRKPVRLPVCENTFSCKVS